jgi:broad specificity phosphatase PhoE
VPRTAIQPRTSTVICFVRHGTTPTTGKVLPGRAAGLHLAEQGREEASRAAVRLAELGRVSAVYASHLERARETAAAIAGEVGCKVRIDRRLADQDSGEWTGRELSELRKLPEWQAVERAKSTFRFPNGESFAELATRVAAVTEHLCGAHPGEVIVAVSHADPIKAAVAAALGSPLDLLDRIGIGPASVTPIAYGPLGPAVLAVSSTQSLSELGLQVAPAKAARRG